MDKPIVSIARNEDIRIAVKSALDLITLPNLNHKKILLKPNVGRETDPKLGINTNPEVVEAVFEYLSSQFQAEFFIGDSPIIGSETKKAFLQSGYGKLLENKKLKFIDLDDKDPITLKIPKGNIITSIRVSGYWNQFDYIISIPVLKMHMHTGASLSFKNMKGIIYKRDKVELHHLNAPELLTKYGFKNQKVKELDFAIADLAKVFKIDLAIIDATYAQEGMGPSSGEPVKLDTIIASIDYLAADLVAIKLVQPQWTLENVPHLKIIALEKKAQGPFSIEDIEIIPNDIKVFQRKIAEPPESVTIKYDYVRLIDIDSCSACLSTIYTFLKQNEGYIKSNFSKEKPLCVAIGKGVKKTDLYEDTFLIGNCTSKCKDNGIFIQGCTPVQSKILKEIQDYLLRKSL